ncbi:hypothetical protein C8R45DRAFT_1005564 [Mycena sanguinolenta]|nr:hypothetical protein C8R45DRAFT_1005564 [Mycena sanguinolenta]
MWRLCSIWFHSVNLLPQAFQYPHSASWSRTPRDKLGIQRGRDFRTVQLVRDPGFPADSRCAPNKMPSLAWIWLNSIYFMVEWRLMPDGTAQGYIAENFRKGFFIFCA